LITIKQIAESLNVSTATVSNVLHGHLGRMSPDTAEMIRRKIAENRYIPNMGARMLAKGDSEIIGVITNYPNRVEKLALQDPFVSEMVGALENAIRMQGFFTILYAAQSAAEIHRIAQTWNAAGLIIMGLQANQCRELMKATAKPIVFVDSYFDTAERYNNIGLDDYRGGYLMTKHLLAMGHREIRFIGDQPELWGLDAHRLDGHIHALGEAGLTWNPHNYLYVSKDRTLRPQDYERMIGRIVPQGDTAWMFISDYYAVECMGYLFDRGVAVPEDISITGFDDNILARCARPRLTTVHQNVSQKAEAAVRALLNVLADGKIQPVSVTLPVRVIKGGTVKEIL
jgi:LacI family transcriptional regulator